MRSHMIYKVFALINLISLVSLIAGLLQPQFFEKVIPNPGRLKIAAIFVLIIVSNCCVWSLYARST